MYPENPEGTQVIVGSMNMGYIILYIRHCQESNSQPVPSQAGARYHWATLTCTVVLGISFRLLFFCGIWECILICQVNNKYYDMKQMEIRGVGLTISPPRRETTGSIPTSTKKIHDIYGAMWGKILCFAAVCAAGWFSCMVVPEPIVYSYSLRAGPVGRISYNLYFDCKHVRYVTCDFNKRIIIL